MRLGLHRVKGLGQGAGERIAAARHDAPFRDLADLAARARLDRGDLDALAAAGALAKLSGHRREAAWAAAAVPLQRDLFLGVVTVEESPQLPPPREGEEIVADYAHLGLTLGRHPLSLLRARLAAMRYVDAAALRGMENRRLVRLAGLVTCRQRPGTASGVIFVTLEDETGLANVIVHGALAERSREPLLGSRLLGVLGVLQREGEVVHLIAKRLVDHGALLGDLLGPLEVASRDFC